MNVSNAIEVVRQTDVGLQRDHNEDAVASDLSIGLLLLADGIGGYRAGEVASEIAVLMIASEMTEMMQNASQFSPEPGLLAESQMLLRAVEKTNATIYKVSLDQPQCMGMGTTLVASVFTDNQLVVGHIGDSRMYRLRGETLHRLTDDHSVLQEQIDAGMMTEAEAQSSNYKNLVTRALGIDAEVELELQEFDVEVGDCYLLCSDGLSDLISDMEIARIMLESNGNITQAANDLIQSANEHGGLDNISVVIAHIKKTFKAEKNWVKNLFKK